MRILPLLFQSEFRLFLFLLWLLWLKLPKLCSGERSHPCLVPDFRINALFFTIEDNVCCVFIIYGFYYVEVCSFYSCFLKSFVINGCWILSKAFSASIEITIWFLIFHFVNVVYHVDWFADIKESLHPWDKAHLVMMYDLFNMLLDSVC